MNRSILKNNLQEIYLKSVYLKCRTNRSDGAKHPTQSESKIQPRACELLLGLLVNCLQI